MKEPNISRWVHDDERHRVDSVGGMRLSRLRVAHHLSITMIGGDDERPASVFDCGGKAAETRVDRLDRLDRGAERAGMPNHIGVRIVEDDHVEIAGSNRPDNLVGHLDCRHLGLLVVGRDLRRWHQYPLLAGKDGLATTVEKERDVRVLLGLGDAKLSEPGARYHLPE